MSELNKEELLKIMGDSIEEGRRNIRDLKGSLDISQDEFDERMYNLNRAEQQIREMIQKPGKEEKIKPLPVVKEFTDYFMCRAKRVLKVKNSEIDTFSIDVHPERGTIWVWVYDKNKVIARAQFYLNGQCCDKYDNRESKNGTK